MRPRSSTSPTVRRLLAPLTLLVGACAAHPKGPPPAPLTIDEESFCGTVLTGAIAEELLLDETPWSVDVRIAIVDELPDELGTTLSPRVQHVFVERSGEPLKARAELAAGVRMASVDEELPEPVWDWRLVGALWPGSAVRWTTASNELAPDRPQTGWDALAVSVSRPADLDGLPGVALAFDGWVAAAADDGLEDEDEAVGERELVHQREHLVLDPASASAQDGLRLLLPAPRPELPRAAQVVEIRIDTAPRSDRLDFQAAVDRGRADLARALARAHSGLQALDPLTEFHLERGRVPLGSGAVDWSAFFALVRARLPAVDLVIEREAGPERVADVVRARELAERHLAGGPAA